MKEHESWYFVVLKCHESWRFFSSLGMALIMPRLFFYYWLLYLMYLPFDNVQYELQRWSLISIHSRKKIMYHTSTGWFKLNDGNPPRLKFTPFFFVKFCIRLPCTLTKTWPNGGFLHDFSSVEIIWDLRPKKFGENKEKKPPRTPGLGMDIWNTCAKIQGLTPLQNGVDIWTFVQKSVQFA